MTGRTFKVDQAIPVEVDVVKDLVHIPLSETLPQQDLEGCPELTQADAAIPIGVKLWQCWSWHWVTDESVIHSAPHSQQTHSPLPAVQPRWPHLSEGIPQLPDANHVCRLSQQLGAHQLHKVFKVHLPATWGSRASETLGHQRPLPSPGPAQPSALPFWPLPTKCSLPSLWAPQAGSSVLFDDFP